MDSARLPVLLQAFETIFGKDKSDSQHSWNLKGLMSWISQTSSTSMRIGQ